MKVCSTYTADQQYHPRTIIIKIGSCDECPFQFTSRNEWEYCSKTLRRIDPYIRLTPLHRALTDGKTIPDWCPCLVLKVQFKPESSKHKYVAVHSYKRKDGTYVRPHLRRMSIQSERNSGKQPFNDIKEE